MTAASEFTAHAVRASSLPVNLPEAVFQCTVLEAATLLGWRVVHIRAARTGHGWRTPYEGHPGLPDLVLARDGRVLLIELKSRAGRPTPQQRAWLSAAGSNGYLFRPSDWPTVLDVLKGAA